MSYWTKRRKIQSEVGKHLQNIANDNENNELTGMARHGMACGHGSDVGNRVNGVGVVGGPDDVQVHNEVDSDHSDMDGGCLDSSEGRHTQDSDLSVNESEEELIVNDNDGPNSSPSSSGDENEHGENGLLSLLARWAIENKITHTALGQLLGVLRVFHLDLPKDPRTLLLTKKVDGIKPIAGGLYYHFGIAGAIESALALDPKLKNCDTIQLQLNVDGLPLFKSSNEQFWPILGRLAQSNKPEPFPIGLFSGKSKPCDPEEFLQDFVEEMADLQTNGLNYNGQIFNISISNFVCDAPARAYIKSVKSHSGYSGCDKCTQAGEYRGKMTFPETDAPLRTDIAFDEMVDEEHHVQPCVLRRLSPSLGLVSQFTLDYMHLVCLGVVKRLLLLWMKGPLQCRLGGQAKTFISECLLSMRCHIPQEFARKPRALSETERWKATEFRLFLLYTGPVALKDKIAKELYDNFLLLSVAIHLLTNPTSATSVPLCDYAHSLLVLFVQHFSQLYGSDKVTYNIHCLVHLAGDVKVHGNLDMFSAFPFESFLGRLKKMVRKPNFVLQQVIMRIAEKSALPAVVQDHPDLFVQGLKKQHTRGFRILNPPGLGDLLGDGQLPTKLVSYGLHSKSGKHFSRLTVQLLLQSGRLYPSLLCILNNKQSCKLAKN